LSEDVWEGKTAWITSFWGWAPETWGTVSFTSEARRGTVAGQSTDPFIVVIYVTKGTREDDPDLGGKVAGFYLVSQVQGDRDAFTDPGHHDRFPKKWRYGFKAIRAFGFLPEFRPHIDDFDPSMVARARTVAAHAERLSADQVERLKVIPYIELPLYGGSSILEGDIVVPARGGHMVRAGPVNRAGYFVPGEPMDTAKELYACMLAGDMSAYLKTPVADRNIYKIGMSISPATRLQAFRKAMPDGAFRWEHHRSTRKDGHEPYPSFHAAESGERAMKNALGMSGEWLGGEFYAATPSDFEQAWSAGRAAALAFAANGVDVR
jgi:hypothetical protein